MSPQSQTAQAEPNVKDIIHLTARLAQVMAAEVDYLKEMKISEIDKLQNEKLFLHTALEAQKKRIAKAPKYSETIPSQDKRDLEDIFLVFNNIVIENERQLKLAKTVNHSVIEAITHVVRDSARGSVYNQKGIPGGMLKPESLSITLNKTI